MSSIDCLVGCGHKVILPEKVAAALNSDPQLTSRLMLLCDSCVEKGRKEAIAKSVAELVDQEETQVKPTAPEDTTFRREYEYLWTIENFSRIRDLPKGVGFMAPFFRTMSGNEGEEDAQWSWGVLPGNQNVGKEGYLGLFVRLRNFDLFEKNNSKIAASANFKLIDKENKVVAEKPVNKGREAEDWVVKDGYNAISFMSHKDLDELLKRNKDRLLFSLSMQVRVEHEVSEIQKDKKTVEYTTHPSVDKFCFQHRIENFMESEKVDKYKLAGRFPQRVPGGKLAIWEATYRRSKKGDLGAMLKLVNGDEFGSCELVSGTHFIILNADGTIAAQAGQRMRDDWNLSTVESGWGRSSIITDDQIESKKESLLDDHGAVVINYTLYLSNSTHERKEGNTDLGEASLDGGKAKASGSAPRIMLSYNWGTKETVHKIKEALESWGYNTWIDDNQMGDNVMLSMAEGVFNSDAVMVCLTDKYQNSFNCQKEASMTYDERKPMIPLKLEANVEWKPWVKLLISGKRYIEAPRAPSFDDFLQELKTYLERMEELKK